LEEAVTGRFGVEKVTLDVEFAGLSGGYNSGAEVLVILGITSCPLLSRGYPDLLDILQYC
jgi:hypothetical protein